MNHYFALIFCILGDSALSDSELDEELALPSVLSGLDIDEKRSLFEFKSTHSEVCS